MLRLPVMVAAGGINSAGRTSHRHAYRRMVWGALADADRAGTESALGQMMGVSGRERLAAHTLVREIESDWFDYRAVPWHRRARLSQGQGIFHYKPGGIGDGVIPGAQLKMMDGQVMRATLQSDAEVLLPSTRRFDVSCAGQLPTGFEPGVLYASRNHPRALQMTVFAISDALADLGLDWSVVAGSVPADAISVYVSSAMGQLDESGAGGMLRSRLQGRRVTSKQCPFAFAEMPGDFISAYVLGSLSATGPALGACATFLYNLRLGIEDIRAGRSRIAVVGAAEAPVNVEVMDGYVAMGALATDKGLRQLDEQADDADPDHRRACRPFGNNCGFTMAESAQVVILMDDDLALELGAPILAGAPFVSVRADGPKKSISGPGAGNYLTMAEAAATVRDILGVERFRSGGMVQAHGTGTPQNRVTESTLLSKVAAAFGVTEWPVSAIKSFVGHSLGAAAGDQLTAMLGIWQYGIVPGMQTVDRLADDVVTDRLAFALEERECTELSYALINSKGFGGNNATAALLSPSVTEKMLSRHHGKSTMKAWRDRHEMLQGARSEIEQRRLNGDWSPAYHFDSGVLTDEEVSLSDETLRLGEREIALRTHVPEHWRVD
ncbi:MAG: beta-ketoacyl synthase [Luminiphilus sp.]|nr:beta-ketoacyl synthase [Luminiphilus sp.]